MISVLNFAVTLVGGERCYGRFINDQRSGINLERKAFA